MLAISGSAVLRHRQPADSSDLFALMKAQTARAASPSNAPEGALPHSIRHNRLALAAPQRVFLAKIQSGEGCMLRTEEFAGNHQEVITFGVPIGWEMPRQRPEENRGSNIDLGLGVACKFSQLLSSAMSSANILGSLFKEALLPLLVAPCRIEKGLVARWR